MSKDFYIMVRGWMDDDIFSPQPYTEREAFLYLIENASWKDRPFRIGKSVINLKRGQLTASLRYLAEAWKWNKNKVDRFLDLMAKVDRVKVKSGTPQNIITICNYSKYQDVNYDFGTDVGRKWDNRGTTVGQPRDKTNKDNQDNKGITTKKQALKKKPLKRKTEIPDGFWRKKGRSDLDADFEVDKFSAHHAGKGSEMVNWSAAWKTWYCNAVEFNKINGTSKKQGWML
jgi:hypothetical protein